MFKRPLIWIQPPNKIDSTWLSTADCVWNGPQWLKSKQCLKLEFYLELKQLFKVSLRIPDASQRDVVNDLDMLKSHSAPYQVTSVTELGIPANFQSITSMKAYERICVGNTELHSDFLKLGEGEERA